MLVLTGTTGNLGSRVLDSILRLNLIPPSELIISSSYPNKVSAAARNAGIEIRQGDFTFPDSLASSFRGADTLFLVSFPSPSVDRWLHHKAAIDVAKSVGIKTVIYTSLMFGGRTGLESVAGVQQAHIKTIKYLMQSGLQYVVVREGIYAESWWLYAGFQPRTFKKSDNGEVRFVIPNDGPVSWVSWDDLGEGTAKILQRYEKYLGQTLNLTGPRATSISDIAMMVERYTGRKVGVDIVGKQEAERYHKYVKKSVSEDKFWVIESWAGWHEGISQGETATIDPLLGKLLGRMPRGIEEVAESMFTPE
ncbi:uncharacterized protein Z518_01703 [Rhinocladiella mackenziei CBS 650.93]|uniref:NmrA-like domain-containing protein n=1 Tax=Rhinocladiella mackenziei CBS 650.93 TaxID=1442369 RepID=A0A0D2IX82_9EURO|nr:uncharacterized protein Z518_01703 [Rhinocladiella mackenziei CBS 650.93]KIX10619.1 hypothetical protein Z518_01703 [Rhinocladiella mackenziei CBS 650.93]